MGLFIIYATHECCMRNKCSHTLFSEDQIFSYSNLRDQLRNLFKLAESAPFVLTYRHGHNKDSESIDNDAELEFAMVRQRINPLGLEVMQVCTPTYLKVAHRRELRLMMLHPSPQLGRYDLLHSRVKRLFKLPDSVEFAFSYEDPDISGPLMTVASDEELEYALEKESNNHLRLNIDIIQERNMNHIGDSPGQSSREASSNIVTISRNGTLRALALSPVELESSCEQFLNRIRELFTLQSSTQLELSYKDIYVGNNSMIPVTLSKGERLRDALSRQGRPWLLDIMTNSSLGQRTSYVVKVSYNGTLRRHSFRADDFQFSYETFRRIIGELFQVPPSTSFVLSYIDEDRDEIAMGDDADLRDSLVLQSLHPLYVNMAIIEGDGDVNVNRSIAQN